LSHYKKDENVLSIDIALSLYYHLTIHDVSFHLDGA